MIFLFQYKNFPSSSVDLTCNNHTVISVKPVTYNYLEPESSINGYKGNVMPNVYDYEQPQMNDSTRIPNHYETDYTAAQTDEITFTDIPDHYETDKTLQSDGKLPNDEPIYKDPGHKKKNLYEWVEKTGIFKFDKRTVRCLEVLANYVNLAIINVLKDII